MNSNQKILSEIFGEYFNSDESFYFKTKEALKKGISLEIEAKQVLGKNYDAFTWLEYLSELSSNTLAVLSHEGSFLDENYKLLIMDDEQIKFKISLEGKVIFDKKMSLAGFSAFQITKQAPNISNKTVTYKVEISLIKEGAIRGEIEAKYFKNVSSVADHLKGEILFKVKNMSGHPILKSDILKNRMELWGFKGETNVEVLTTQDFGIKDIILLNYLENNISQNCSNEKLFIRINNFLESRKVMQDSLYGKITGN